MNETSRSTMLVRGLTRRCAHCGSGKLFHGWFKMVPDCTGCGMHFERETGYWTGALAINFVCTAGLMITLLVGLLVATIPKVPVAPLLAILVPVAIVGPLVWYPFSKTLWVAIDVGFLQQMDTKKIRR